MALSASPAAVDGGGRWIWYGCSGDEAGLAGAGAGAAKAVGDAGACCRDNKEDDDGMGGGTGLYRVGGDALATAGGGGRVDGSCALGEKAPRRCCPQ